jgi:hypothetical protein
MILQPMVVMAGLVPAIHAAPLQETSEVGIRRTAWMPGTRPGRTRRGCSARRATASLFPRKDLRPGETNPQPKALISPTRRSKRAALSPAPHAAARLANMPRPSTPPTSGSIRFSGCGIRPRTLRRSL